MWKDYSQTYIKYNRASSISIMAAALIASLFLSLLCSLAYNTWTYDIIRIQHEEGDWQGRVAGELQESDLALIQNDASVEKAVVNETLSDEQETVVDVYFHNPRTIYQDMPRILEQLGMEENENTYHSFLLSRYFIHDPNDSTPPLLLAFYLAILIAMSFSLILIIRNAFELSMNARVHQFGIFSSIGATPKQIKTCLLQEAVMLSGVPILVGSVLGVLLSLLILEVVNVYAGKLPGRIEATFAYHPLVFLITLLSAAVTVLISAWIPAKKLSRMTPLEAIRNAGEFHLKRRKHPSILSLIFGFEGELAQNALKAQKKSLRISSVSLLLSFLGFSVMLCFVTLSDISTRYTYFDRYQDAWDIMVTVKETDISDFEKTKQINDVDGIGEVTVYQKADERIFLATEEQSEELSAIGGLEAVAGLTEIDQAVATKTSDTTEAGFWVNTQTIIMDDESFLDYCAELGAPEKLDGVVVINQIWDSVNSSFRNRLYVPFIKENQDSITIYANADDEQSVEVPVLAYTERTPVLREEYDDYELIQFVPVSLWENVMASLGGTEADTYIRIFSEKTPTLENLNDLEARVIGQFEISNRIESENRIQEKLANDEIIKGSKVLLGGFCTLLAIIGLANIFSHTLGFIRQRKREFAQYMSIGLTPAQMKKMFRIEAVVIAGKPLLITLVLTVLIVHFMMAASFLDPMVFWVEAPVVPILIFATTMIGFVTLAYYIGEKRILECDLNETLRNDVN